MAVARKATPVVKLVMDIAPAARFQTNCMRTSRGSCATTEVLHCFQASTNTKISSAPMAVNVDVCVCVCVHVCVVCICVCVCVGGCGCMFKGMCVYPR